MSDKRQALMDLAKIAACCRPIDTSIQAQAAVDRLDANVKPEHKIDIEAMAPRSASSCDALLKAAGCQGEAGDVEPKEDE